MVPLVKIRNKNQINTSEPEVIPVIDLKSPNYTISFFQDQNQFRLVKFKIFFCRVMQKTVKLHGQNSQESEQNKVIFDFNIYTGECLHTHTKCNINNYNK